MTSVQLTCDEDDEATFDEALPAGTELLNGQYTIERYLSSGGFCITYIARDSLDRQVVIKECYPEAFCSRENKTVLARSRSHQSEFRSFVEMFVREAHSVAKLNHPNIVGVHQVFEDNETAYMALDLIDGTDLLETIELGEKFLEPGEVKDLLLKVLDAISTVHEQDMLHRDISPDNILIDAWSNPVLIDFGAAREEASKKSRALSAVLMVKDGYSPQEFYIAGSQQSACSDLYALAATFYYLISGHPPSNSQARLAAIASGKPDPCEALAGRIEGYQPAFLEAIDVAMNVFPQDRIQSAREWILKIDDKKRSEVALANAQRDKEIEKTVMQLIIDAQKDAEKEAVPEKEITSESVQEETKVKKRREPEILLPEEPCLPPAPIRGQKPVSTLQSPEEPIVPELCEAISVPEPKLSRSGRLKRKCARLVLGTALLFAITDGQAAIFAEAIGPIVLQVMHVSEGSAGAFG